jgi:hypothetical protein
MAAQTEVQAGAQALQAAFPTLGAAVAYFERREVTDAFFEELAGIVLDAARTSAQSEQTCPVCMKPLAGPGVETSSGLVVHDECTSPPNRSQIGAMPPERYARAAKRAAQLAVELAGALAGAQQVSSKVRWLAEASLEEIEQRRRAARPSEGSRRA